MFGINFIRRAHTANTRSYSSQILNSKIGLSTGILLDDHDSSIILFELSKKKNIIYDWITINDRSMNKIV
jgi:hypothetical protein